MRGAILAKLKVLIARTGQPCRCPACARLQPLPGAHCSYCGETLPLSHAALACRTAAVGAAMLGLGALGIAQEPAPPVLPASTAAATALAGALALLLTPAQRQPLRTLALRWGSALLLATLLHLLRPGAGGAAQTLALPGAMLSLGAALPVPTARRGALAGLLLALSQWL